MQRRHLGVAAVLVGFLMVVGCAVLPPKAGFTPVDLSSKVSSGEYTAKVDNFYVVMDASSSMNEPYQGSVNTGYPKFDVEKDLLTHMNQTLPALDIQSGIAAFGLSPKVSRQLAINAYGPETYSEQGFADGLNVVSAAGGTTPMGIGIDEAGSKLKDLQGKSALIVVSDGQQTSFDAVGSAEALKSELGDNLCIYTVWVGGADTKGQALMEQIAEAGGCGFATTADAIMSPDGMADFVEKVFLAKAPAKPVAAPPPPAPAPKITWILSDVNFDFDKWDLRPDAKETLNRDLQILKENPQIKVEIQGHTCDLGDAEYNQMLSEKRAQSVMNYMIENGIAPNRLTYKGYGEERPRFPNDSEANRERNRRVEMVPFE